MRFGAAGAVVRSQKYTAKQVAADLNRLAEVLQRLGICGDTSPLASAAENCRRSATRQGAWQYQLSDLIFRIVELRGLLPLNVHDLQLILSVSVAGSASVPDWADPFRGLSVDLVIQGRRGDGGAAHAAWHLDRHLVGAQEETTGSEMHPLYHFQYGGRRLHEHVTDFGETLLLHSPRLLHPPMEAILTVDFVLANFLPKQWQKVRNDGTYCNLVDSAYERLWDPYFRSIAAIWPPPAFEWDSTCFKLCPALVHRARE